jgi:hypothetical protein
MLIEQNGSEETPEPLHLFGADGETRTRTAFATTTSR